MPGDDPPDTSISGRRVARELTTLIGRRGKPEMIVSDNGRNSTECHPCWSKDHMVEWHYTAPGKSMQNGYVESFNGRMPMEGGPDGSREVHFSRLRDDDQPATGPFPCAPPEWQGRACWRQSCSRSLVSINYCVTLQTRVGVLATGGCSSCFVRPDRYAGKVVDLSLSTLADQVGASATALQPIIELIRAHVLGAE